MNAALLPQSLKEKRDLVLFDDFTWFVTAHQWTSLVADTTPTVTVGDAKGGRVSLFTDTTDNNEVAIKTTAELFLMAAGKPMWGMGAIQYAEANTDDANVMFGFMSALAANSIVDNGASLRTTGNYAVIYKLDGGTVWRVSSRNGTEVNDNITLTTAGGSAFIEPEIRIEEFSPTQCVISYLIDGVYLRDATTGDIIQHRLLYASATEMNFGVYAKTGGSQAETIVVDWLAAGQVR